MILLKRLTSGEYFDLIIKSGRWKIYSPYKIKVLEQLNDFITFAELTPDKKILEIGSGFGHNTIPLLQKGFNITCIDCNNKSVELFKQNLKKFSSPNPANIIISDIFSFDPKTKYDAIIGFGILHHIADSREKLEQLEILFLKLKSMLNTNGTVAFIEPKYTFLYRLYVMASFSMNWDSERGALFMKKEILENMLKKCSFTDVCYRSGKKLLDQVLVKAKFKTV
ncbi:MAG: class I SAM-dependent methyltransferase [Candidatus Omnitrophica bacterium]|nr:class I SAM-dependent methyltransferase [Candidatus Omnitrophota bacterium]